VTTNVDGAFDAFDDDPFEPPAVVEFIEGMMFDGGRKNTFQIVVVVYLYSRLELVVSFFVFKINQVLLLFDADEVVVGDEEKGNRRLMNNL